MVRLLLIIGFSSSIFIACTQEERHQNKYDLVSIENEHLKIIALPEVGGRVVHLSVPGKDNIFKADTVLWQEARNLKPGMGTINEYKPYHGHVVWLGPMSAWWQHQNLYPGKKTNGSRWPPDPFLDYGDHTWQKTGNNLKMTGPSSPISGVKIEKVITVDHQLPKVTFSATTTNIRDTSLGFDLWFNTRLDANCRCYVPVNDLEDIWFKTKTNALYDTLNYQLQNGFFTFVPPQDFKKQFHTSKAFIHPSKPYMAAFCHEQVLIISFPFHSRDSIHPEQAMVEIFNQFSNAEEENLLEWNIIHPFKKLVQAKHTPHMKTGGSMNLWKKM